MKIAFVMMQKNEEEMLNTWVKYHASLVGYHNLYIYDNGSNMDNTHNLLSKFIKLGVNVYFDKNSAEDFENKGNIICQKIKELDESDKYDFCIPLDCDEFVGVLDETKTVSFELDLIESELKKHIGSKDILMFYQQYLNSQISTEFLKPAEVRKCFFYNGNIKSLDVGFHNGKANQSNNEIITKLILVHLHYKPYEIAKQCAKNKLTLRVKDFESNTLRTYKGKGMHLVNYFLLTKDEFIKNTIKMHYIKEISFKNKLFNLGIEWPYFKNIDEMSKKYSHDESFFCRGYIDIVDVREHLVIKGWCSDVTGRLPDSFTLNVNDECFIKGEKVCSHNRYDVVKENPNLPLNSGFTISFEIEKEIVVDSINKLCVNFQLDEKVFQIGFGKYEKMVISYLVKSGITV